MASFELRFSDAVYGTFVASFEPLDLAFEIKNSEPGSFSCELPLGASQAGTTVGIRRDSFAPYRTDWQLWRTGSSGQPKIMSAGMLTSVNLNTDRDSILISGKDWLHYLQRRIYPFTPEDYVTFNPANPNGFWDKWPKRWPEVPTFDPEFKATNPVDLRVIVEELLLAMRSAVTQAGESIGQLPITFNNSNTGTTGTYEIYPGDSTTIFDHIKTLSEMKDGFEFDIHPISLEFRIWSPRRDPNDGVPIWWIRRHPTDLTNEQSGAIIDFDWTNDGPEGTYLIGLGTKEHKVGATWTDPQTLEKFRWMDKVYDYGELAPKDMILNKLKDQNDLWPQKKLGLTLLNPEFMSPSFYTGGRPRNLIGARVRVTHNFAPYHTVDAYFRINGIQWRIDENTNEEVALELEMVYEPETGLSGGISDAM